jgi:hypothetical protein
MRDVNRFTRRRRWWSGGVVAGVAIAATVAIATPAQAWTAITATGCDQIVFPVTSIDAAGAHTDVSVVVHTSEFYAGGASGLDFARMSLAINYVNAQFNQVGATAARIAGLRYTSDPFTHQDGLWYGDTQPTIHVGFVTDLGNVGAAGETRYGPSTLVGPGALCTINEASIAFLDTAPSTWQAETKNLTGWNFNSPATYYDALNFDASAKVYFRPSYLHELLHAFGLAHSPDTYSMMNYGVFPWANRPVGDRIRPLPDDVQALRELYPDSLISPGSRYDMAVLNTWFAPDTNDADTAGTQSRLCAPSLGNAFSSNAFGSVCGTGGDQSGSTQLCEGSLLRTRFTIANYSTESVDISARLWFSLDDQWDPIDDVISPSALNINFTRASEAVALQTWSVPAGLNTTLYTPTIDYHAIVRITGTSASGTVVDDDWIPLRGIVQAKYRLGCVSGATTG